MILVSIDFVPGSHGQFLEYVCNKFIAKHSIDYLPFNKLGASHVNQRNKNFNFIANHYSLNNLVKEKKVIKITFNGDDLLLLSSGCFLRAGDSGINVNNLEINTFNKLKNGFFYNLVDQINNAYKDQVTLTAESPNCPRYILREFFKFGFKDSQLHGLIIDLQKFNYTRDTDVFEFKFEYFYNTDLFLEHIDKLAAWYGTTIELGELKELHEDFLSRQIFKDDKKQCDYLLDCVSTGRFEKIENISMLQESYINAKLENLFQIEMPFSQENYFKSTQEIVKYIDVQNKNAIS